MGSAQIRLKFWSWAETSVEKLRNYVAVKLKRARAK